MFRKLKRNIANHLLKELYNIKCKEIEEKYLPAKPVKYSVGIPETVYKRTTWNVQKKQYDVRNVTGASGINSIGFFRENIGLSHAARYFTRVLKDANIPFAVKHFDIKNDEKNNHEFDDWLVDRLVHKVNVFNFNANYCMEYQKHFPEDLVCKYNIGYGFWEFEKYPLAFLNQNNFFDEIWAPSDFILHSLCKYYAIPVVKMPVAVDFNTAQLKQYDRKYFGLPENKFIYIFTFDIGSEIGGRKNSFGVIDAFCKAFEEDNQDVLLLIKAAPRTSQINTPQHMEIIQKLNKATKRKNIIFFNKILSDNEMKGLINTCQVYVSLHRCEGLGLGLMEAMKMGKPVIATGYSGNTEFMKPDNSCLVDYKLIPSALFSNLVQDCVWADPDISQAAYYMKKLYDDNEYYKTISQAAKDFVDKHHNNKIIGEKIKERLMLLGLL